MVEMTVDLSTNMRFTRTERALLRVLIAQGGQCEDGYGALARAVDGGERSMQRATRRLQGAGLLSISRRGYGRTAQMALTESGRRAAAAIHAQSADTPIGLSNTNTLSDARPTPSNDAQSADTPIRRSSAVTRPAGFIGDPNALTVARITARIGHDDSPLGLARAYIAQIDATPELARIAGFLDEHGFLPVHAEPTGLRALDEGLRAYFAAQARKARSRDQMRTMARGLHFRDEE